MTQPFLALITPLSGGLPDQSLPPVPGYPSQGLPWFPGHVGGGPAWAPGHVGGGPMPPGYVGGGPMPGAPGHVGGGPMPGGDGEPTWVWGFIPGSGWGWVFALLDKAHVGGGPATPPATVTPPIAPTPAPKE